MRFLRNNGRKNAAFTLLEVAAVLVVFSLLSSFSAVQAAFTLIEMSMILVILSLLASMIFNQLARDARLQKAALLQKKFDRIEQALFNYAKVKNGLPCPALPSVDMISVTYGVQASNPGRCVSDSSPDSIGVIYSNAVVNVASATAVAGMLPVNTLASYGLEVEDTVDPYGGRFLYVVPPLATANNAFLSYGTTGSTTSSQPISGINVMDNANNSVAGNSVIALVLSHGANGHGAHQISGLRKSSGSTNFFELANCHCSATATATAFDNIFYMEQYTNNVASPLNSYDDSARYYTRNDFKFAFLPTPAPAPAPAPYADVLPDAPP